MFLVWNVSRVERNIIPTASCIERIVTKAKELNSEFFIAEYKAV